MNSEDASLAGVRRRLARRARDIAAQPDAADVPSPCVSICRMHETSGLCVGCLRSIDEIAGWRNTDSATRRAVWLRVGERAQQLIATTTPTP